MKDETPYDQKEVAAAFAVIKKAMQQDSPEQGGSYAHSWHVNLASTIYDTARENPAVPDYFPARSLLAIANEAAARFMKTLFDVETHP